MDLIDTSVKPDPFNPQAGDVYEYDAPPHDNSHYTVSIGGGASCKHTINTGGGQRTLIVVEHISHDVWVLANGERLAKKASTFHLFIASLSNLAAVGRVRDAAPVTEVAQADSVEGGQ